MTVISDASPLVSLARIEALELLSTIYGTVTLPEAVWHEVVVDAEGQPGAKAIRDASWIETQTVSNQDLVQALRQDLDDGEAEAIALAVETDSPILIMDDQHGRARADHFEIPCIGVIGVLIEAKDKGHIRSVRSYLDALRKEAGFHIGDQLYRRVLRDEGEL
jgi:predicted nucleic acid-binding protein